MNKRNGIPTRELGITGEEVTVLGVGGFHIGKPDNPDSGVEIIRQAIDEGINFLDNAWCYHQGESEKIMGEALQDGYREKVILMTKNHGRDRATFNQQLEDSLRRLQTDYIDLLQFHEIIHEGEPERIENEGALDAALKAKKEGKIRYIGFTGHRYPGLLQKMLEIDFSWDTIQMPLNVLDYHYRSFTHQILPKAANKNMGVIGMKSLVSGNIFKTGISVEDAIGYSLSLPICTLVSGIDSLDVLQQNLKIVRNWQPFNESEKTKVLESVKPFAREGKYEHYKKL